MLRTISERAAELQALRELAYEVPESNDDGEPNREAVDAQINVIDAVLTQGQIYELYEGDDFVLNAALDAERWLREDDESPVEHWREQISIQIAA